MIKTSKIETPLGEMVAGATEEGVCLLEYHDTGKWFLDHEKKYSGQPIDLTLF